MIVNADLGTAAISFIDKGLTKSNKDKWMTGNVHLQVTGRFSMRWKISPSYLTCFNDIP